MIKKFIFIIMSAVSFSFTTLGMELEDYYLQLKVKSLTDDFFMGKYDSLNDEIYLGMNSFFYFMELYDIDVDIKRKKIFGKIDKQEIKITFEDDECAILDDELYVKLEVLAEKLNFKSAKFSSEDLRIVIEPRFELPYEKREKEIGRAHV